MIYRTASAPAKPVSLTLAAIARPLATTIAWSLPLAVALAIGAGSPVFAQQQEAAPPAPGAAPAAKAKPAKKAKPAAQAAPPAAQAQQPAPAPAPQPQPGQGPAPGPEQAQGQGGQQQVQLIYSPWTKFCLKGQEANPKQVCFTGKDARIEFGMPVVAAVLIEPEGQEPKSSARDLAARHAARSRHPRDHRPEPADDRALRDLLHQRLHGRLRGQCRHDRQDEERPGPRRPGDQFDRPADQPGAAARGFRQSL